MNKVILIAAIMLLLITPVRAEPAEIIDTDALENAVPEYVTDILGSDEVSSASDVDGLGNRIIAALKDELQRSYKPAISRGIAIVLIAAICSVLDIFGDESSPFYIKICACTAVSLVCSGELNSFFALGGNAVNALSDFANALLPTLCAAGVICGTPLAAAAKYAASMLFIDILITVASDIILPLIYAYTAAVIASAAFGSKALSSVCGFMKWLCTSLMIALTLTFVVYISISTAIASGGDAVATKVTKTAISMSLPVVGGIISDAASAVIASAELMRNLVGVFGLFVVLAICLSPFIVIGLNCLVLKASAAIVKTFDGNGVSSLIGDLSSAYGMLLALTGSAGLMVFISVISCIKAVGS